MAILNSRERYIYKKQFQKLVLEYEGKENNLIERYSIKKDIGNEIYKSFSDKELLQILRLKAKTLNHTPSQKEVPLIFKEYIKARFKKWPYALKEAGLSKAAGSGSKNLTELEKENKKRKEMIVELRKLTMEKGYIPHPHEVPEISKELKKVSSSWSDIIKEAGLDKLDLKSNNLIKEKNIEPEIQEILDEIKKNAYEKGRAPLKSELESEIKKILLDRFGSWRNVLFQIDLEPVRRIRPFANTFIDYRNRKELGKHSEVLTNCYYKVLNLREEDKKDLKELKKIADANGGSVDKKDVSKDMKKRLQQSCGTWSNALWQIGIDISKDKK